MDDKKRINIEDLSDLDFDNLPDGANYVYDGDKPVAVLMNIKYYKYLEQLMSVLRKNLEVKNENP